jgi:hypothetical protein
MSLLIYPRNFNACHLHFGTAVQNNDAADSKFSRIVYSTKHISFIGVGILVDLAGTHHDPHYNKVFVRFDPGHPDNKPLVSRLHDIECGIVGNYVNSVLGGTRRGVHSLRDQLNSGCIKAYVNDHPGTIGRAANAPPSEFMLKICGIWETKDECGMTYKFIQC